MTFHAVFGKLRLHMIMEGRNSDWLRTMGQIGLLVSLISSFVLPPFFGGSTVVLNLFVLLNNGHTSLTVQHELKSGIFHQLKLRNGCDGCPLDRSKKLVRVKESKCTIEVH